MQLAVAIMNVELGFILPPIIALIETVIYHLYFVCFLGEKYKRKSIYFIALTLFFITNSVLSVYSPGTIWIMLLVTLFCFIYPVLLFSGTILQRLFVAGLLTAYTSIAETVSTSLVSWIFNYSFTITPVMNKMYFAAAFISKILLLFTVLFITKMKRNELLKLQISRLALLLSVVLICTFLSYMNLVTYIRLDTAITLMQLITGISIFVLSVLVFYIYQRLVNASKKDLHTELLTQQLDQDIRYFKHMDSYLSEIRSLKHDFTIHLTSMRLLLCKNNYSELANYIDKYLETVHTVISEIITGLPSVDATISFKKSLASKNKIGFIVHTKNISKICINPVHLNIILSNLLDNAIHACLQLPESSQRKVEISLKMEQEYFYIKVRNSSMPVYFIEGTLPQTTKSDKEHHGLGLETIKRLVLAYDGILHCEYSNEEFVFIARLKNIDNLELPY